MTRSPLFHLLLLLALAFTLGGCAAAAPSKAMEAPTSPAGSKTAGALGGESDKEGARAEIERLMGEIDTQGQRYREEFGVEDGGTNDPTVPGGTPDAATCERVCEASAAICESSRKICDIAQSFVSEPEFAERCTWATGECTEGQSTCKVCMGETP